MIHHASPDSSKNIVREFGEFIETLASTSTMNLLTPYSD